MSSFCSCTSASVNIVPIKVHSMRLDPSQQSIAFWSTSFRKLRKITFFCYLQRMNLSPYPCFAWVEVANKHTIELQNQESIVFVLDYVKILKTKQMQPWLGNLCRLVCSIKSWPGHIFAVSVKYVYMNWNDSHVHHFFVQILRFVGYFFGKRNSTVKITFSLKEYTLSDKDAALKDPASCWSSLPSRQRRQTGNDQKAQKL